MDDSKLRLMASIIKFLREEYAANYLDAENAEGLEVAIHCLENIFDVRALRNIPSLMDIYNSFLNNSVLARPDATEQEKREGERLKTEGNVAMAEGRYADAMSLYTRAINSNPKNAVYYCNRAAAKSKLNDHLSAICDCKIALELDPKYSKAYGRLGLAYCGLDAYISALENYRKAYQLEPGNEGYKRNFELAQKKVAELCSYTIDGQAPPSTSPSTSRSQSQVPSTSSDVPSVDSHAPGLDMVSLLGNPQLLNLATQMLSDPELMNMMSSLMSNNEGGGGINVVLQAGQTLARQMQSHNPAFLSLLREGLANRDSPNPLLNPNQPAPGSQPHPGPGGAGAQNRNTSQNSPGDGAQRGPGARAHGSPAGDASQNRGPGPAGDSA